MCSFLAGQIRPERHDKVLRMPLLAAPALNAALRMATLGTRFVLVFILAKYLDAKSVGQYGLFTAAVSYALLCVGLDLYFYTTREIVKLDCAKQGAILKFQAAIVSVLYIFLMPLFFFVLPFSGFPTSLVWWFFPILILEHINQELYRLLVILSQQLSASVLLFIRQGSWALIVAALMISSESTRSLKIVLLLWTCAGLVAALAGIQRLRKLKLGGWRTPIDWAWIKKGLAVSLTFLIATLALRAIQTFDRYWLERLAGIEIVGAYVLFFGIASALSAFLDSAVFSFRYPEIVTLSHQGRYKDMRKKIMDMGLATLAASILFAIASSITLPILLHWIGKEIYISEIDLYYYILGAMIFYALSMVPHYGLYALGKDGVIIASHVAAVLIFALVTATLADIAEAYAVPLGVLAAMSAVFLWKITAYLKAFHYDAQRNDERNARSGLTK